MKCVERGSFLQYLVLFNSYVVAYLLNDNRPSYAVYYVVVLFVVLIFIAGRPKAALLFCFFGDFRCGALLFVVIHVIYSC